MEIYLVGGAVRDELLKIKSYDKDYLVLNATPEDMLKAGFEAVGKDFPVFLHPQTKCEYALARTERKVGKGYKGFVFYTDKSVSLEEDLRRRDFSINSLAKSADGKIIDFYGGLEDLKNRILRHTSPAFVEDPLRVLRMARFYAKFFYLGFKIHKTTLELAKQIVKSGEIEFLTKERIWQETHKALITKNPAKYFSLLLEVGCLQIITPQLAYFYSDLKKTTGALSELDELSAKFAKDENLPLLVFAKLLAPLNLDVIKKTCEQLKAPKAFLNYSLVAHQFLNFKKAQDFCADSILKLCGKTDFWRKDFVLFEVLKIYNLKSFFSILIKLKNLNLDEVTSNKNLKGKAMAQAIFDFRKSQLELILKSASFNENN